MREIVSTLITKEEIEKRIDELALEIERDYAGSEIVMVCVLSGSMVFASDLMRKISSKVSVRLDAISASSYGTSTKSSGRVNISLDTKESLTGKNVIIIEDIVDTGRTLDFITYHIKYHSPKELKVCALLDKPSRREVGHDLKIDYLGFTIDDHFVVGYGIDYAQKYRNLPYIGFVSFQDER